jgi:hypothetical protein
MFTSTTLQLTGLDELKRRLYDLPNKVEAKVVRGALVEGARVIRDNARAKAPEWHGDVAEGTPGTGHAEKGNHHQIHPRAFARGAIRLHRRRSARKASIRTSAKRA